jgi:DnaK suppressor protein
MTTEQKRIYKTLLAQKHQELSGSLLKQEASIRIGANRYADSVDQSAEELEVGLETHVRQNRSELLKAIQAAMSRIDQGSFGSCEICTEAIPFPRLNAVPWANLCRDCKEQQDSEIARVAISP